MPCLDSLFGGFRTERRASRTPSRTRRIYDELRDSSSTFDRERRRHARREISEDDYNRHRSRLDRARVAYRDELDYRDDRRASADRRFRADYGVLHREPEEVRRTARFSDSDTHRRESQYRDQRSFRRASSSYQPGSYAAREGGRFYNTSQPRYVERHPTGSTRRRSSTRPPTRASLSRRTDEDDYQDYLDTLTDEQLNQRRRAARRALLRFQN